jgi:hypothetical protein
MVTMQRKIGELAGREFDLVIVGGGICGAAAAWDATQRGLTMNHVSCADLPQTACGVKPSVRDLMSTDIITVTPDLSLRSTAELFAVRHLGGAPVMAGSRVVGVISTSDILAFEASTPTLPRSCVREPTGRRPTPRSGGNPALPLTSRSCGSSNGRFGASWRPTGIRIATAAPGPNVEGEPGS